jgi:phosphonate transport system permease protein
VTAIVQPASGAASVRPRRPKNVAIPVGAATTLGLLIWAIVGLDAKWSRLLDAPYDLYTVFRLMLTKMTWSDLGGSLRDMWDSIAIAWLGTLLAACVAVPFGFLAAENLVPRWFSFLMRQVFNVLRSIPELLIIIAVIPVLGLTKSAGVLAIAIGSIGTLSKLCSEVLEAIDKGPIEAVDAVGASQLQRLRWAVVPQAIPEITAFILYRFEINIRVSAILGVIGIPCIGNRLTQSLRFKEWGQAGLALIVVVVATIAIDTISGAIRRRIIAGPDRLAEEDTHLVVDSLAGPMI